MKTYSMDLRERVLQAYLKKQGSQKEIAERFGVSTSWVKKIMSQYRKTNSIAPLPAGGDRRSIFTAKHKQRLKQLIDAHPDATLAELQGLCGVKCSMWTIWRALGKLGYTRKKRRYVPVNKTAQT